MGSEWKVDNSSKCIAPGLIQCLHTVISKIPEFRAIKITTIRFKQSHFRHTIKLTRAAIPVMQGADCSVTRGHDLRLLKYRTKYDLRKYYFTSRVVNVWNSLPSSVVSAVTVNCFKSRLDKFRKNQEIVYDYHAHIQGTGNQSEVVV